MTPFVPGFENDLFISYAHHDDPAWTQAFEKALREEVSRRLGLEIAVWQDEKRIRAGQNWQDEIKAGIERCAAFVAIISPSYENSDWCTRERVAFRQLFASPEQFESSNRFFIAVKTPWEKNNHRFFLSKIKPVLFFRAGEEAERDTEFLPGSSDFRSSIAILATGIADLLRRLRRQRERVFVGSPQDECVQIWRELGEELRTLGYDVQPPGRRDASFADELVRQEMNGAKLSIHLIGSAYDEFIERQIVLAADLEHRLVFWLAADSQSTGDPRQRELVTTVRDGKRPRASNRTLPDGWMLLRDISPRKLIDEVLAVLKPKPAASVPRAGDLRHVYIIHDATTQDDTQIATTLKEQLSRREGFEVSLSRADLPSVGDLRQRHERLMKSCEGVLLCRNHAPQDWMNQLAPEVIFAERLLDRQPLRSRAFLLADPEPWSRFPNLRVIPYTAQFQVADLEPFLAPLR